MYDEVLPYLLGVGQEDVEERILDLRLAAPIVAVRELMAMPSFRDRRRCPPEQYI